MRPSLRGTTGAFLLIAVLIGMNRAPEAAKSPYPQPCSVTFQDRVGDKIYSDSQGAYVDGTLPGGNGTISCQVGGTNSDGIKLILSSPSGKNAPARRWFWGAYDDPLTGGPTGSFTDGSYIIIEHVAYMPIGASGQGAGVHFRFHNGSWFFNWCGLLEGACANYPASDYAWVTHGTNRQWDVTANFSSGYQASGDIAQLQDGITNSYAYHMPFELLIDCPGCPN
jgi:hypothetical protein